MSEEKKQNNDKKREMISFLEIDEKGMFREAYGYIEPKTEINTEEDEYFKKKIQEINEILKRR